LVIDGVYGCGRRRDHEQRRNRRAWRADTRNRLSRNVREGYGAPVGATFIFLLVILKIPIGGLLYIVWWAIHAEPDPVPATTDDDGGSALPRPPRRGPHGTPPVPAPPRVRTVVARARRVES
jgi:hypothetical protein